MNIYGVSSFLKGSFGDFWIDDEYSRNGLQVKACEDVDRIAFAVDACLETIEKAAEAGAQMLVVHHGLCWGSGFGRLDGITAERVATLFRKGVSLFGCHLPLDAHPVFGNNAVIARRLGLKVSDWFCESYGLKLAALCRLDEPVEFDDLSRTVSGVVSPRTVAYYSGKGKIRSLGILSGSGDSAIYECAERGIDCLLTGEFPHKCFHDAKELGVSVLSCGHYDSENTGIQELKEMTDSCLGKCGVTTVFIDAPTFL